MRRRPREEDGFDLRAGKKKRKEKKEKKKLPIRGPFDAPRGILEALMTIAYEKRKGLRTLGSLLFGIGG